MWGFALAASCAAACSSSNFETAPSSDSGASVDGTTDDTGGTGGDTGAGSETDGSKPLCVIPPTAVGGEGSFCQFEAELFSRCGQCEACRQTNLNGCVQLGDALSATFKSALLACKDVIACGDYTTYVNDPCVHEKLLGATLTAAQKAAKDDYCAKCPSNVQECASFFDVSGGDAGPDAGVRGIGAFVLISDDAVVKNITTKCSGGLNCNPYVYELCSGGKVCDATAPDACKSGACGK
jgi:hypothetical protein